METCLICGARIPPGEAGCAYCQTAFLPHDWIAVYRERGVQFDLMEDAFRRAGFLTTRKAEESIWTYPTASVAGAAGMIHSTLYLRRLQYEARQEEVETLLHSLGAQNVEDPDAIAEAEEEYDVRACAACNVFLHSRYTHCPGCGQEVVPAVEIFREGQLTPNRIIVGHGTEEEAVALHQRLRSSGFPARAFSIDRWSVDVVDLPWDAVAGHIGELDAALSSSGSTSP